MELSVLLSLEPSKRPPEDGTPWNEMADDWAKLTADEPDAHRVEFLGYGDRYGRDASPRPLTHLERSIPEIKWKEPKAWADVKFSHKKYRHSRKPFQKPDSIPASK